jgi:hypothetical protein
VVTFRPDEPASRSDGRAQATPSEAASAPPEDWTHLSPLERGPPLPHSIRRVDAHRPHAPRLQIHPRCRRCQAAVHGDQAEAGDQGDEASTASGGASPSAILREGVVRVMCSVGATVVLSGPVAVAAVMLNVGTTAHHPEHRQPAGPDEADG